MSEYLPEDVRQALALAERKDKRKRRRLRVQIGDETYEILRYWDGGFSIDAEASPHLRGRVDLFEGAEHLSQCLIVACSEDAGEMICEFKRETPANAEQPRDYVRDDAAPVALIEGR